MSKGKNGGWKLGFCDCFKEIIPVVLVICCPPCGVGITHFMALKNADIKSPSPIVGCLATTCCLCLGAAIVRQAIRKEKKLPMEHFCYDCSAYMMGMTFFCCCMAAQDLHETKK